MMAGLAQRGSFTIPAAAMASIRKDFAAVRADEDAVAHCMRDTLDKTGYLLDPHTAVGVVASRQQLAHDPATPSVVLATAHPAKFPDAVKKATGIHPALPPHLSDLLARKEHFTVVPNDVTAIETFIGKHSRIGTQGSGV